MKIGILSDIHGNMEALDVVLAELKECGPDRILCLGDLVGYGPNPNECIEKIASVADIILAGNHDHAATGQLSTEHFNEFARKAIDWTRDVLDAKNSRFLSGLPLILVEEGMTLVHATPEAPADWNYIFGYADARRSFSVLTTPVCFVGHSHVPVAFIMDESGEISIHDATRAAIQEGNKIIINAGSVGQPRDGDPRASYGIFDTDDRYFYLKRVSYAVDAVQEKMRGQNLPSYLIDRLSTGH